MSAAPDDRLEPSVDKPDLMHRRRILLAATFVVAYVFAAVFFGILHETHVEARRVETRMIAQGYAQRIQERLQSALVSTHILGSMVRQSRGNLPNFDEDAAELMTLFPGVSALQLAPDGVIRDIYPLAGNEAAIGHDLLADRKRNREAAAAVTTRQLTLAGPFKLLQGGMGTVGRLPIFLANERGETFFWGFAIALIRIPSLLDSSGLSGLARSGYRYELWRMHPDTDQKEAFARSGETPPENPVEYVFTVPNGRWVLSIAPEDGWLDAGDYLEIFGLSLVAAIVVTILQYSALQVLLSGASGRKPVA